MKTSLRLTGLLLAFIIISSPVFAATWDGGGSGNLASDAANWSGDILPSDGDAILFDATSPKDCLWDLVGTFYSFHLEGGYFGSATLTLPLTLSICPSGLTNCGDACYLPSSSCSTGLQGVCAAGSKACSAGAIICNQNVQPSAEICDGLDNNCNAIIDDGNPGGGIICNTGLPGVCTAGTTSCMNGSIMCVQNVQPSAEICDGLDNNCNAIIDDGNPGGGIICNTGLLGVCAAGTTACQGGVVKCNQNVLPSAEICDGLDNNCNGTVDEGVKITFYRDADSDGYGNPTVTVQACSQPAGYVSNNTDCNDASNSVRPGATEVCNGIDDNCNGSIDEGNPGGGISCGACNLGTTLCSGGALTCLNANQGLTTYYRDADADGYGNPSVTTQACSQPPGYVANNTDCNDTNAAVHPGATEFCNGIDDNCNGTVDEGNPGGGIPCNTGLLGVCAAGTTACQGGAVMCIQNVQPLQEICGDGLDNDCNGIVDNGCL